MSVASPLGAIGGLAIALLTVHLLQRRFGAPSPSRRFATLDGLRGYAAFLVFIGHSSTWYVYARTGVAAYPPSRLYLHFGESSVALFFMITGLLFWSKLIDGRARPIDWRRLYVSRVLRLAPLFAFLIVLLWAVGLATSGPRLRVSVPRAVLQTLQWMTFTIAGMPDINHTPSAVMGGPAWSLPYEWWFYLSLPLAGRLIGLRPPRAWLALGVAGTLGGAWWISAHVGWAIASAFLGGIACAFLAQQRPVSAAVRGPLAAIVCLAALAAESRFASPFAFTPTLLLSVAFAMMACGNTLFGVLEWPAARGLGEMGYSIYLLHAVVLYIAFGLILGTERTAALSMAGYWSIVYACGLLVVLVSFVTFRFIEAPAMASVDRVSAYFQATVA